jgi:hypothetical protein
MTFPKWAYLLPVTRLCNTRSFLCPCRLSIQSKAVFGSLSAPGDFPSGDVLRETGELALLRRV